MSIIQYGNITVGPNTTIILDGTKSYDPDIKGSSYETFSFEWKCFLDFEYS